MSSGLTKRLSKAACSVFSYKSRPYHWEVTFTTVTSSLSETLTLEAIHVPGHSPGSLVYYCAADHCMFSGDVLFQGSIGRADLAGGNFRRTDRAYMQPPVHTPQ